MPQGGNKMDKANIYHDIAKRTQGDIYIGVVGPVRTGKSTFIKKFMETLVLPNIENDFKKERAIDELPQSAAGRTIMTTEPKFIPNEAVEINIADNASFKVRLIDCVGYIVPSALGYIEDEMPRMVITPWYAEEIPFNLAAEIGTQKVINEHSTIGLVITTDGSIGEIPRSEYEEAEKRVISELKSINKPFIVLLNTVNPSLLETRKLAAQLEESYGVPVMPVNCINLDENTIKEIIEKVLFEFPIREVGINMPSWIDALDFSHWLKASVFDSIGEAAKNLQKICQIKSTLAVFNANEYVSSSSIKTIDLGSGTVLLELTFAEDLFYKIIGETTGIIISDEGELITTLRDLATAKKEYDKVSEAINDAVTKGYGIVTPSIDELTLEEPEIVKHGGRFGVKLKASAPSIHMIRADIETEVSPIVGSEKQSEELVKYLLMEFEESPKKIWESNIFGKSLHELVNEGLHNKLNRMPDDARDKIQETLQKIINEGSGGLICIIL
jgi:stage IV sporulation protein A